MLFQGPYKSENSTLTHKNHTDRQVNINFEPILRIQNVILNH